jgi:spermidine synthase
LLFLAGVNLMLLHFLLVQRTLVAIRQDETAVLVFSASYFAGISLGYALSGRVTFSLLRLLLPVFFCVQMLMMLYLQSFAHVVERDVSSWALSVGLPEETGLWATYAALFATITLGATSLYSVFLPAVIDDHQAGGLRRCYSLEVAGSLLGFLLIPLLSLLPQAWMVAFYFAVLVAIALMIGMNRLTLTTMALLVSGYAYCYDGWDKKNALDFYQNWYSQYDIEKVIETRHTPYHKIEVLELENDEHMLVLNGKRQFVGDPRRTYSYFVASFPASFFHKPQVCTLGCGSMATVGRIGRAAEHITIVDIDEQVFEVSKKYFPQYNRLGVLDNWTFRADDAKHFLGSSDQDFDLILHDIPPARSRQVALTYTAEFFEQAKSRLSPQGIFSISALSSSARSGYGCNMLATLAHVFDHYFVVSHGGSHYFYGGHRTLSEPKVAELRKRIERYYREDVRILTRADVDELVKNGIIITTDNVGDLIYD